jgi:hypothetical protein
MKAGRIEPAMCGTPQCSRRIGYRIGGVRGARCLSPRERRGDEVPVRGARQPHEQSLRSKSHRHLAMPHRRAGREAFGRVDDGVRVKTVMAIQLVDRSGLAEMLDAKGFQAMAADTAEPG